MKTVCVRANLPSQEPDRKPSDFRRALRGGGLGAVGGVAPQAPLSSGGGREREGVCLRTLFSPCMLVRDGMQSWFQRGVLEGRRRGPPPGWDPPLFPPPPSLPCSPKLQQKSCGVGLEDVIFASRLFFAFSQPGCLGGSVRV